ncbi:hypothetical protein C2E23DRAFT_917465 [Lenzites betulinus]|nr:hypothetical protein C2E23DRAFT_917465 [Lenzites betulinus]
MTSKPVQGYYAPEIDTEWSLCTRASSRHAQTLSQALQPRLARRVLTRGPQISKRCPNPQGLCLSQPYHLMRLICGLLGDPVKTFRRRPPLAVLRLPQRPRKHPPLECAVVASDSGGHLLLPPGTSPGDSEEIVDDDWEYFDGDQDVSAASSSSASLPEPALTPSGRHTTPDAVSSKNGGVQSDSFNDSRGQPIPLNVDALARVDEPDVFGDGYQHGMSPRWGDLSLGHPAVVLAMLLVSWLHLVAHLPYRFCNTALTVVGFILAEAGQSHLVPALRSSLAEPHPESVTANVNSCCCKCGVPLFKWESVPPGRPRNRAERRRAKAILVAPFKSITEQLAEILLQPGHEEAMDSWRRRPRWSGWLCDFFDGAISKVLLGPDGRPFFRRDIPEGPQGELRIGLALGIDWFSYLRSLIAPSYTSCPMSFNIVNFPPHLRYRASNLLLSMIIPGPRETDPDQTQRPGGRLVRVALVGVFCDKPAAHKIGGFGSHAHTFFCTRDWISQGLKATVAAFTKGGVVKTHFYHIWVQLKLFRKTKELRVLHDILGKLPQLWEGVETPSDPNWLEKRRIALRATVAERKEQQTAKRKRVATSTKGKGRARANKSSPNESGEGDERTRRSSRARKPSEKGKELVLEADDAGAIDLDDNDDWMDVEPTDDSAHPSQLHPRDLTNFLKLCSALKLYLADQVHEDDLQRADTLMREYCIELMESPVGQLYGPEVIRPNHHYATHTPEFVRDYGPLREFWTFLFERLNKILKSYRTNNHEGGEIETTFFREFHRSARLHRTMTEGMSNPASKTMPMACKLMMEASSDNRGTLQQLAQELEEQHEDGLYTTVLFNVVLTDLHAPELIDNIGMSFSPRSSREALSTKIYFQFVAWMNTRFPEQPFHSDVALTTNPRSRRLANMATVFDYAIVAGHRYHAAHRSMTNVNSLALCRVSGTGATWVGEIQDIVLYIDDTCGIRDYFAHVLWLRRSAASLSDTPWAPW